MMKRWTTLPVFLFLSLPLSTQQGYGRDIFVSFKGGSLSYRMIHPEPVKLGERYSLVLLPHGTGERRDDNEKQLTHGGQIFLNPVNQKEYPAFVLIPQCPAGGYWVYTGRLKSLIPAEMPAGQEISPILRMLKQLLDPCLIMSRVDTQRVYVIDFSTGTMGTYDLVAHHPEVSAAAVPTCGTTNPSQLSAAKDMKFCIFHEDADDIAPMKGFHEAYKAPKTADADVEYIKFLGRNHGSWNPAFNHPRFMD